MGAFTRVLHPQDGRELQIYTGGDVCQCYRVGDTVAWGIDLHSPGRGTLLDGAYRSYSDQGVDDWVVIKDHKVHAVIPPGETVCESSLWKRYGLQSPPYDCWATESWERAQKHGENTKKEIKRFKESIAHLPLNQQFVRLLTHPLTRQLAYDRIGRAAFHLSPAKDESK